ncbi:low-specificity L-threonine aldolase 1 [Populus alba x Populus x berolinensis]|nr:low-specificity L-threonine aldolase 1 [Populus alba x Populus x berolinensis]
MRAAMANAEVDDDVLNYDPSALRLETEMAKVTGKEAALFVPSGTMGNLVSVLVHCNIRGSEVILGNNSHIHIYENGGISTIGGVHPRTVKNNDDGTMDIDLIEAAIRDPRGEIVYPTTRLICLENTQAKHSEFQFTGFYKLQIQLRYDYVARNLIVTFVRKMLLVNEFYSFMYLKLLNQVCLSKGVGAPVGSVIVGSKSFIAKARILRKTLGGGMRQVGILCAAALVALHENVPKLEDDHKKSKMLAEGLNQIKGLRLDVAAVETNIIFFDVVEGAKNHSRKAVQELGTAWYTCNAREPSQQALAGRVQEENGN